MAKVTEEFRVDLNDRVAVVTGASRGAGRAIAAVLGDAGATVYVTGRSVRGGRATEGRSGTIQDTAELVSERGGVGIAVRCDHTVDADVERLFERVRRQRGRLDLLVNNAWGGYEQAEKPTRRSSTHRSGSSRCGAGMRCSPQASAPIS